MVCLFVTRCHDRVAEALAMSSADARETGERDATFRMETAPRTEEKRKGCLTVRKYLGL